MAPIYDLVVSGVGYKKQRVCQLAATDKEKLLVHFEKVKDPKLYYALMYFYGNAHLFHDESKKAKIFKILSTD
jgi:hypothetical protein